MQNYLDLLLKDVQCESNEVAPGVYMHTFTPPEMTLADVGRLLSELPTDGGPPSKGTKKDGRLTRNKPKPPVKKG